jgi:four helix bundle protein
MSSYRDLDIYKLSFEYAIEIHKMSLTLPKYELYEQGSQIRKSSKSIKSNIVEGYGRRRYKDEFIRFLVFAHASCDETIDHLKTISLIHFNDSQLDDYISKYEELGAKISSFIKYVEQNWKK